MNSLLLSLWLQETNLPLIIASCLLGVFLVGVMLMLALAMRIVPEYARLAMFRLGRFVRMVGPGIVILMPFVDRGSLVDLREKTVKLTQEAATQDKLRVQVAINFTYRITDPVKSVLTVANLDASAQEGVRTRVKSVFGTKSYSDAIHYRTEIEDELKQRLGEAMQAWGCEITSVDILDINKHP